MTVDDLKKAVEMADKKELPSDKAIKETFGVVNNGCDSKQVVDFIEKTTGHRIKEIKENE